MKTDADLPPTERPRIAQSFDYTPLRDADFEQKGLRAFMLYRDLGLRRATGRELALTPSAHTWLQGESWPGNVRQLKATIERAALLSDRDRLDAADLRAGEASVVWGQARETLPPVGAMTLDELERAMIDKAMRHHAGNVTHVADALGLTRAALYRRLKKYGLAT